MATLKSGLKVELPFDFGTKVHIDGDESLTGTATGFAIYSTGLSIEVAWFINGSQQQAWFPEWRLKAFLK